MFLDLCRCFEVGRVYCMPCKWRNVFPRCPARPVFRVTCHFDLTLETSLFSLLRTALHYLNAWNRLTWDKVCDISNCTVGPFWEAHFDSVSKPIAGKMSNSGPKTTTYCSSTQWGVTGNGSPSLRGRRWLVFVWLVVYRAQEEHAKGS